MNMMKLIRNASRRVPAILLLAVLAGCSLRPAQSAIPDDTISEDPVIPATVSVPETESGSRTPASAETEPAGTAEETRAPDGQPDPIRAETGEHPTITAGHWWKFERGTFVYDFPKRDRSGETNLDSMYDVPNVPFDDVGYDANGQPNGQDWYSGKTQYDETTGESTVLWERSAATLRSLADHRGCYRGDTTRKVVYFTFDCGYEQDGLTGSILDTLKEKNVPGTFFINGYYVESAADYIRRMLDEGHIVANHALNHEMLTAVSVRTFYDEVIGLENKYFAAFPDAPPMLYFRPPSGNCNDWVLTYAEKLGYITALYSFAYTDWEVDNQPDLDASFANLKSRLHPGCVYLFHTVSETNTKLIPLAIDWIREQGYEIIPLCDIEA